MIAVLWFVLIFVFVFVTFLFLFFVYFVLFCFLFVYFCCVFLPISYANVHDILINETYYTLKTDFGYHTFWFVVLVQVMFYWSTPTITYFIISRNKTVFFVIYIVFDQKQISTAKYISIASKRSSKTIFKDNIILSYKTFT